MNPIKRKNPYFSLKKWAFFSSFSALMACAVPTAQAQAMPTAAPATTGAAGGANAADAPPATAPLSATATEATPPHAEAPEGCRIVSDRAMAADLKAANAQAQKSDPVQLGTLLDASIGLWALASERCSDRAQERARRNLADSQRSRHALEAEAGAGPECTSRQKDATRLQDLAQQAVRERRWLDASVLYRKAENMWDVTAERCTGDPQRRAVQRRDQTATDAHNAEFCAPVFERAREQTQSVARQGDSGDKASRQQQQAAETLWRDAMAQCKGPALDIASGNAQRLAKERGTPWVPTASAPTAPTPASSPPAASAAGTAAATASDSAPVAQDIQAGDTRFQGQWVREGNLLTGQGQVTWANGDAYQGELRQSRRHGQGEFTWANGQRYQGTWANDAPHGTGNLQFANGNQYEGELALGVPHGQGRMAYATGDRFKGQFLQGKPDGAGAYRWANGQTYEGPWTNDQPNGQGVLTYANGNRYVGQLRQGTPDGTGTLTHASGDVYTGQFQQGAPQGEGTYAWASGDRYSGQWHAGRQHGQGRFDWAGGDRWEGQFDNDAPTANGTLTRKTP